MDEGQKNTDSTISKLLSRS